MKRLTRIVLSALLAVAGVTLVQPLAAQAQTTGQESFKGFLVVSGTSGSRQVLLSPIRASGVFNGLGRIVERENLPGDPEEVSRDDLVFRAGTLSIVSTSTDFSIDVNPATCFFAARIQQHTTVDGGTGIFADATGDFTGMVVAHGLGARNADGTCAMDRAPLFEVDVVSASGTLSY